MVLVWMVYAACVAGVAALAALAAERALRLMDRPARGVWVAAAVASLVVPGAAWLSAGSPDRPDEAGAAMGPVEIVEAPAAAAGPTGRTLEEWTAMLTPLDPALAGAWAGTTGLLLLLLAGAWVRIALARTGWGDAEIDGHRVRLSQDVGPAVVGLLRPEIVLPGWVLEADPVSRRWIVRHEREHLRAGDPALVAASALLAVLLPWNLPLWWQLRRLRQAVEIDCDRRVLGGVDRSGRLRYGRLLLQVGRRGTAPLPVPAGFAETTSFLERRIRAMTELASGRPRRRAAVPAVLAALLLAGSCMAPGPDRTSPTGPEVPMEAEEVPVDVSRPEAADREDVARRPIFTPYSVAPTLTNADEVRAALEQAYPPLLRDAGISGRVLVYFFIDEGGAVRDTRIHQGSGHDQLDEAALRVAGTMKFTPALNRDEPVPVWIRLPITFRATTEPPAPPAAGQEARAAAESAIEAPPAPEPPRGPGREEALTRGPTFTPYTVAPTLRNEEAVRRAMEREYPPLLKDAGIGGRVSVHLLIAEDGEVRDARLDRTSGHDQLDAAALRVAREMEFGPALLREEAVPVWISLPITFAPR